MQVTQKDKPKSQISSLKKKKLDARKLKPNYRGSKQN